MANEFDIFNVSVKDLDTGERPSEGRSDLYAPKPDQGQDGTYRSLIRFLPNAKNPRKPFERKYVYWLEDREGNGFFADSPSTVGEKCPVQDMFFKLRNSESAVDKKMSEGLKRREVFYALVQIIKDPQNRDLEGQVKIMKFGYKIKTKIDEELNPQFDEPTQVFDPFEGKNFELVISKKGGFPNYDSSKFHGNKSAMEINGEKVTDTDESRKAILDLLKDAPDLATWGYKAWDDSTRGKVMNVLSQFTSPGDSIANITASKPAPVNTAKTEAAATQATTETTTSTTEPAKGEEKKDDFDDFINGLDL
tara:strand:+ start:129 stop:1049 length:921 start_codon:yes stop_codon:yes gene_type:complete